MFEGARSARASERAGGEYATNYANAVEEHFGAALGQMPDRYASMLQQIEEEDGEWDMVPPHSTRTFAECGKIAESHLDPDDPENTMDLSGRYPHDRYRLIKDFWRRAVDLI